MGQLDKLKYQSVINRYPKFEKILLKYVYTYLDPQKNFFLNCLSQFSYFQEETARNKKALNQEQFHSLMYLFKQVNYTEDEIVLKEMQLTNKTYIVASGNIQF